MKTLETKIMSVAGQLREYRETKTAMKTQTNTETAQQAQHTPGAIRAADAIFKRYDLGECEYTAAGVAGVEQDHRELVELIDRETAAPDILEALKEAERVIRWAAQEASGRVAKEIVGGWLHHADKTRAAIARAEGRV